MVEGVVHGHIHNSERYTYVHGHVHHDSEECEGFEDCRAPGMNMLNLNMGMNMGMNMSTNMDLQAMQVQANPHAHPHAHAQAQMFHEYNSASSSGASSPVQCCNPNILEICCDLDHPVSNQIGSTGGSAGSAGSTGSTGSAGSAVSAGHSGPGSASMTNNAMSLNTASSVFTNDFSKDMMIFTDNALTQLANTGTATATNTTTTASTSPIGTRNDTAAGNEDEDMKILQDLCNISQLYELPMAKHINHHHHNHGNVVNLLEDTHLCGGGDANQNANSGDGHACDGSHQTDAPCTGNCTSGKPHHHHRIQVHPHDMKEYKPHRKRRKLVESPMFGSRKLVMSPQPLTSHDRHIPADFNDLNTNTINFNWNFRDDDDIHCQWDDCGETYTTLFDLQRHMLKDHITNEDKHNIFNGESEHLSHCQWKDCEFKGGDICSLVNHINDEHGIHFEINVLENDTSVSNSSAPSCASSIKSSLHFDSPHPDIRSMSSPVMIKAEQENDLNDSNSTRTRARPRVSRSKKLPEPTKPDETEFCCKWAGCNERFKSAGDLNDHLEEMHLTKGKSQYTCEWEGCNKTFSQRQKLVRHLKVHSKYKPYQCPQCQKCFSTEDTLNQHKRVHSGEKPYECHICHKRFAISNSLKIHIRTHTGEKPLKCKVCGRCFNESSNLSKHMKTHMKKYFCSQCSRSFDTLEKYKAHELRSHPKTIKDQQIAT